MADTIEIKLNGGVHSVTAETGTPLLYVLMNDLALKGPKFGCGLAQCGCCSVLIDGKEVRSCIHPVSAVKDREITTLEGVPARYAEQSGNVGKQPLHPVQIALLEEQAPQCGYCYNGMIIKAVELLDNNPAPSEDEIKDWMSGHLCRCGTYPRIIAAIKRAASKMGA